LPIYLVQTLTQLFNFTTISFAFNISHRQTIGYYVALSSGSSGCDLALINCISVLGKVVGESEEAYSPWVN